MPHISLFEEHKASMVLLPLLRDNTAAASKFVDMQGFEAVDFLIMIGATDITVDAKLQESANADGSSAADITGAAITQVADDEDNRMLIISLDARENATERYVGCVVTVGDGTAGANTAVVAVRYRPSGTIPVTQEAAGANAYATAEVVKV